MYSFDIFDTIITRSTAEPEGIFMLMQEKLQKEIGYDPLFTANFYELRVGAEKASRRYARLKGRQEISLEDIYRILAMTACVSEAQTEELKKLEVKTECDNILGIKDNIDLLKKLIIQGERVVLISDMYLDEACIRHMLCLVDPIFKNIPIYVSSAYGKSKANGALFWVVHQQEQVEFSDWIHYGDNENVDIKAALKLGIKAKHLAVECLKEYEKPKKNFYHQLSVGISQYIRSQSKGSGTASEIGSSLAGPILYPYVSWILKESMNRGIKRLYFVARDGWILWQMADIIIRIAKYPIRTSYIYGSRAAWRLSSYDGSKEDLRRIIECSNMEEILFIEDLAKFFGVALDGLLAFLPPEMENIKCTRKFFKAEVDTICKWLEEKEEFRSYLLESQRKNQKIAVEYLQKEIDVSDDHFAFVELSGTGLTQQCLSKLIGRFYDGEIKNFFYGLDDIQEDKRSKFIQFYPNALKLYILELLCRAPHGQTKGYKKENNTVLPVLEGAEGEQIKAYHMEEYKTAVLMYVDEMEKFCIKNGLRCMHDLNLVDEYIRVILEHPPKRIAEYFCHMPFSSSGRKASIVEFAPAISKGQLRKIYFWENGKNVGRIYHGDSIEYALLASDSAAKYKEWCQKCREKGIGKWLVDINWYLRTHQKPEMDFFCPWEFLKGDIVIYGAGKVGQSFVKQAKQKYAKCNSLLWIDSNYLELQEKGMHVKSPEEILGYSFDRIIIAIHNSKARQDIWEKLRKMGVEAEKIYYG